MRFRQVFPHTALLMLCTVMTQAQGFHVRILSATELAGARSKLNRSTVPRIAGQLQVDSKQVFELGNGGKVFMYIVPVRYDSYDTEVPTHTSFRCGVFILPEDGPGKFYPTIGYGDSEPVQCRETRAVDFVNLHTRNMPPTIFVIYGGNTPNTETGGVVVFSWNPSKNAFFEDERLESSLSYDPRAVTASTVRRQLLRNNAH